MVKESKVGKHSGGSVQRRSPLQSDSCSIGAVLLVVADDDDDEVCNW